MAKAVPLSEFRVNSARILEGLSETRGFAYLTRTATRWLSWRTWRSSSACTATPSTMATRQVGMSKASDLGYWVKDHGGVVFAAIMVVALVAMFVAAIVVSSQQPEAEPEDTVSGGYVGSWYHVEYDKAYVLTLNGDGTARYYDKTLVQPLMFGKWEVGREHEGLVLRAGRRAAQRERRRGVRVLHDA